MADVRQQVVLSLMTELRTSACSSRRLQPARADTMLDQVVAWSTALAPLRDLYVAVRRISGA